ncbi:extensin-like [Punica granatum]|uniref:Extensin-like n=1 Tax=Punica granatum TaxID=22663 RepID=A0A6P8C4E3_PUNGR|nr:extensin-like [Punica granatum]
MFWDSIHAVFNIQGTELAPTIEEYRTLISRTAVALADRIDAALASVVLQVVGGREYEVTITGIAPLSYSSAIEDGAKQPPASFEENTPPTPVYYQPPMTQALPPPTLADAPSAHLGEIPPPIPTPEAQAPSASTDGSARIVALEGDITTLKGTVNQMAADMAELMALLRALTRTSSNSTPPPGYGPTVDPNPWVPPTHAPKGIEAPAMYAPTGHSANIPPPSTTFSTAIPPPLSDPTTFALPPMSIPAPAPIYAAPPPMVFPVPNPHAPAHMSEPFPFQAPDIPERETKQE